MLVFSGRRQQGCLDGKHSRSGPRVGTETNQGTMKYGWSWLELEYQWSLWSSTWVIVKAHILRREAAGLSQGAQQGDPKWEHRPYKELGKANQVNMEFHRKNNYQGEGSSTILVIVSFPCLSFSLPCLSQNLSSTPEGNLSGIRQQYQAGNGWFNKSIELSKGNTYEMHSWSCEQNLLGNIPLNINCSGGILQGLMAHQRGEPPWWCIKYQGDIIQRIISGNNAQLLETWLLTAWWQYWYNRVDVMIHLY